MKMIEKVVVLILVYVLIIVGLACVYDVLQERIQEADKYARTSLMFAQEDKKNAEFKVKLDSYRIKLKEQKAKERKEIYEATVEVFKYGYFQGAKASGSEKAKEELYKEAEKWIRPYAEVN